MVTTSFSEQDICRLPQETGNCAEFRERWFFDYDNGECHRFMFSGCNGNENNFASFVECEKRCSKESVPEEPTELQFKTDVCALPQEPGPCLGYYRMWYYDRSDNICKSFVYGGCEGNGNRFEKRTDCETSCVKKVVKVQPPVPVTYPPPRTTNEDVCRLPVEPGPCDEAHPRWFYDAQTQNCLPFVFGGCGGNKNRFKTSEICLRFCTGITATPPERRPYVFQPATSPPEPTQCPPSNCANLQCPYGIEESFDISGCSSCRCSNPCEVQECPDGSRCAIDVVRTSSGGIRTEPVCRRVNKSGVCPAITDRFSSSAGDCDTRCRDDADCRGDHKCCNNGCAMTCVSPAQATNDLLPDEVLVPATQPEPAHINPGPNVTEGHIGEPAELPCNAMGWPRPTVTWWRDTTMLPLSSRRYEQLSSYALLIRSVVYEDAGEYSCHAHNGIGSGAIFKVSLIIDLQPEPLPPAGGEEPDFNSRDSEPVLPKPIEFAPLETRVSLVTNDPTAGAPLQIDCTVNGPSEGVEVTWRHQNQVIEESDRRRLLSNQTLFITKAEVADSGEYRCNAEYENSFSTSSIQIVVKEAAPDTACIDNPQFSNCEVIVRNSYCSNKFYGKFCCASCMKAGQLAAPPDA
ncbi:unnamed protein product [Larinioides sclopetarius]|uniref:Papilin n=1 Tax=Larinioides sclopetarius TaxID=280406 RepID=A0AAV1Z5U5_9ARAC